MLDENIAVAQDDVLVRGELIAQAYAALDAGDAGAVQALLAPDARWIGVAGSWGETPT
jgi:ketosteroid isomerase-like protein